MRGGLDVKSQDQPRTVRVSVLLVYLDGDLQRDSVVA